MGAIVADTQAHAQRAAKAVKISYEELQPVIVTIQVCIFSNVHTYTHHTHTWPMVLSCAVYKAQMQHSQ